MPWSFPSWRIASVGNHDHRINDIISCFACPGNTHVAARGAKCGVRRRFGRVTCFRDLSHLTLHGRIFARICPMLGVT